LSVISDQLDEETSIIYDFERALQAPVLEMMIRGILTDEFEVANLRAIYTDRKERIQYVIDQLAGAVWSGDLNAGSYQQLKAFFYDYMGLPQQYKFEKGKRKVTVNRDALEKLCYYRYARPIAKAVLAHRDMVKRIAVLKSGIDPDGRMRFSYNIGGTNTGRFSCNENVFGGGTNANNITDELRRIFIAPSGRKLAYLDLEQAESRVVAYRSGDEKYIDACESSDLHVYVAKLVWPDLKWSHKAEVNPNSPPNEYDKAVSEQKFYRHFSYRDLSKRGGHLCLTADHEVLTPHGWVNIREKPDTILSWSEVKEGIVRRKVSKFESVTHWTDEAFTGELHEFEGNSMSLCATPNHRMPYKYDTRVPGIRVGKAEDGPKTFMPLGSGYVGGDEIVPARLIAAFMADGSQSSKNRIVFHLKKERKIKRLRELGKMYGFDVDATANNKYRIWSSGLPKRAGAFMLSWTRQCIDDFVDEYKHWDGHIGKTSVTLSSMNRNHLEWIQTLGRVTGVGGNVNSVETAKWGTSYRLQQNNRQWANGSSVKHSTKKVIVERVLCPTVPSEFFYVRRNGKIFVTGNTNYLGQPDSNAKQLQVSKEIMRGFHHSYLDEFSGIRRWHTDTARVLQTKAKIITSLGRKRLFFGRTWDDTNLRKAIAYDPQSTIGDLLNLGMWRVWKHVSKVDLLTQLYDAILVEYDEEDEDEVIPAMIELMSIPISVTDTKLKNPETREMMIPVEASVGWNWGKG
jgi:hypothetical protein